MDAEWIRFDRPRKIDDLARIWVQRYLQDRYLVNVHEADLMERISDLMDNALVFNPETRKYVPFYRIDAEKMYNPPRQMDWLRKLVEARAELDMRGITQYQLNSHRHRIDEEIRLSKIETVRRDDLLRASHAEGLDYQKPTMLFRYSKAVYNRAMLDEGAHRFVPAQTYNDTSLLKAQRDDENRIWIPSMNGWYECSDFLVLCMSSVYSYRLYNDFGAESCLVIHDPAEYERRLVAGIRDLRDIKVRIAQLWLSPVVYYDPHYVEAPEHRREIYFSKHFRFAYQYEFRAVLIPTREQALEPLAFSVGSLQDIAELIAVPNQ